MEELYHRCRLNAPVEFLFTTMSGHVVAVHSQDLPHTSPYSSEFDPSIKLPAVDQRGPFTLPAEVLTYLQDQKLQLDSTDGSSDPKFPEQSSSPAPSPSFMVVSRPNSSNSKAANTPGSSQIVALEMVYNEYGELISAYDVLHPPSSKDMSALQILRIINKGYHHNYRTKIGKAITLQMEGKDSLIVDDGSCVLNRRISAWEFKPRSPKTVRSRAVTVSSPAGTITTDATPSFAVYNGPPRVLEIGCGDGSWCFQVKEKYPDWIIEGVDDINHWSGAHKDIKLSDFMVADTSKPATDYFSNVHVSQEYPEFTVRNLNQLIKHPNPVPFNLYGLVRARDIFDKIENWKTFLEDVRLVLQPDGVVEFLEVDPRPRRVGRNRSETTIDHTSGPKTDWTDKIADRFKDKNDEQLATNVPGWMGRVLEELKATLRPRDGVPGPNLKSWLEGSGFWDVKQTIIRLPVGGKSKAGQLMKNYILFKHANEDCIPNLKAVLPVVEMEAIGSGDYYLNLHIVTGRKARHPRAGDLLLNGSRQEMTALKYEAMARTENPKSNQWKRFDLDHELTGLVHGLSNLSGAPSVISPPAVLTQDGTSEKEVQGIEPTEEKAELSEHVEEIKIGDKDVLSNELSALVLRPATLINTKAGIIDASER